MRYLTLEGWGESAAGAVIADATGEEEEADDGSGGPVSLLVRGLTPVNSNAIGIILRSPANTVVELKLLVVNTMDGDDNFADLASALCDNTECRLESLLLDYCDNQPQLPAVLIRYLNSSSSSVCRQLKLGKMCFSSDLESETFFQCLFSGQLRCVRVLAPEMRDWINLVQALPVALPVLRVLHTKIYNGCNPAPFFRAVLNTASLVHLDISGSFLYNPGAVDLAEMLLTKSTAASFACCQLERLNIQGCRIGHEGGLAVVRALALPQCRVEELDMSNNPLQDAVVEALGAAMPPRLRRLVLSSCGFGDRGAVALARAVITTTTTTAAASPLEQLEVSSNELYDAGVCALADAAAHEKSRLTALVMSHSGASKSVVVRRLCRALRSPHCRLEMLYLGTNTVDEVDDDIDDNDDDDDDAVIGQEELIMVEPIIVNQGEEEEEDEYEKVDLVYETLECVALARCMLAMASARAIPRLGKQSAVSRLPQEILRSLGLAVVVPVQV